MSVAALDQNALGERNAPRRAGYGAAGICTLAVQAPLLTAAERTAARDRVLRFARQCATTESDASQEMLYPAVSERLDDPLIQVSMNYDRLAMRRWISAIEAADVRDTDRFQRLLYGLDALMRVHRWKQIELQIARVESPSSSRRYGC